MADTGEFLSDLMPRPLSLAGKGDFQPLGLFLGNGQNALEVAVVRGATEPSRTLVLDAWKARRGGRAAPVLLVALNGELATLCGPAGEDPPIHQGLDAGQAERLCREALAQPDRHAALRFLSQALPSLETALPGINNEGLLALHELTHGVSARPDWAEAGTKARRAVGKQGQELLKGLGFRVERLDNLTHLLRSGDKRSALGVLLDQSESPETGADRFNSLSPVSYALAKADAENLPWVVLIQGNRVRLYPTAVGVGVGRRGRTETYVECQPALLSDEHLGYLWLLFSADALGTVGSLSQILEGSRRFSGDLADRLRDRLYEEVVPALAKGIVNARDLEKPSADDLDLTYRMALTWLPKALTYAPQLGLYRELVERATDRSRSAGSTCRLSRN